MTPFEVHYGKNANGFWTDSVENRVRKTANQPTADRTQGDRTGLGVFNDFIAGALHLSQESAAESKVFQLVVSSRVIEFLFG